MLRLPDCARLACWVNAWLAGRESPDAVIAALAADDRLCDFQFPGVPERLPAALFLGELRRAGARRLSSALPVPGDLLGLGGPADFNVEALTTAEAVVLHGPSMGLVPHRLGSSTTWTAMAADPPAYLAAVADADRMLRAALTEAADALSRLDVASWRPEVADVLLSLRDPSKGESAPFASAQCARLAGDALRALTIVSLAGTADDSAVTARESRDRSAALRPLDRAARTAVVASTSTLDGR